MEQKRVNNMLSFVSRSNVPLSFKTLIPLFHLKIFHSKNTDNYASIRSITVHCNKELISKVGISACRQTSIEICVWLPPIPFCRH